MKDLYIIGAGGFGREVAWLVERINSITPTWNIVGFIDDDESLTGTVRDDYTVLGSCDYLKKLNDVYAVCAIGNAESRKKVIERLQATSIKFASLIDPSVIYSKRVKIGEGSIICAGTIMTVDLTIGNHVIIDLLCTLGHDDYIGDFCTIYPSVNLAGSVHVGACSELGTGTQIIHGKNIGSHSIVGAGAVVITDIPDHCTAVGVPAKVK